MDNTPPPPPSSYSLSPKAAELFQGYIDRIKSHANYNTIATNNTDIFLAYLATPELRQLYESEEPTHYKRHGELIPEMVAFYSKYSHEIDTREVVRHIQDRMRLTSYYQMNIMNACFEGKQIPKETMIQFEELRKDAAFLDIPIYIPTKGYTKVKPFVIVECNSQVSIKGLSTEQMQDGILCAARLAFKSTFNRFFL